MFLRRTLRLGSGSAEYILFLDCYGIELASRATESALINIPKPAPESPIVDSAQKLSAFKIRPILAEARRAWLVSLELRSIAIAVYPQLHPAHLKYQDLCLENIFHVLTNDRILRHL